MATKAELEAEHRLYLQGAHRAIAEFSAGRIVPGIQAAVECWPYVDGTLKYVRKYAPQAFAGVAAFDLVLQYAPVVFETRPLDALAELLKTQKSILKNDATDLAGRLPQARRRSIEALRLWNHLERNPGATESELPAAAAADLEWRRWLTGQWETLGHLRRSAEETTVRLTLASDFDARIGCKCPACGAKAAAARWRTWSEAACPRCGRSVVFTILS